MQEIAKRLDVYLVESHMFPTRQKAKFAIEKGIIFVNGKQEMKASKKIEDRDKVEMQGKELPFVSRGGLKLQKAVHSFSIKLTDKICADIGASTGGFTDCMLQNGAKQVYAIDVGHDQLVDKIKQDRRVVNMEGTNIKEISKELYLKFDFASVDVSFISILQVFPQLYELLKIHAEAVILIKPQFEAGRENLTKTGVVKNKKIHQDILKTRIKFANDLGFQIKQLSYSPIKGPAGNIEYLLYIQKNKDNLIDIYKTNLMIDKVVEEAFQNLK